MTGLWLSVVVFVAALVVLWALLALLKWVEARR